jgi:CheY-like chemotaxis protein
MTKIFLIDDDPVFVFLLSKIISSTGEDTQSSHFNDGQQAIDHLQTISDNPDLLPDVIFLDLSMPVMDGWEFLDEYTLLATHLKKKIDLYIVSSSISPDDFQRSKSYSDVHDFLIKPVDAGKIASIMHTK